MPGGTGGNNVILTPPLSNGIAFNSGTYASPSNPFGASPSISNFRYPMLINVGPTPTAPRWRPASGLALAMEDEAEEGPWRRMAGRMFSPPHPQGPFVRRLQGIWSQLFAEDDDLAAEFKLPRRRGAFPRRRRPWLFVQTFGGSAAASVGLGDRGKSVGLMTHVGSVSQALAGFSHSGVLSDVHGPISGAISHGLAGFSHGGAFEDHPPPPAHVGSIAGALMSLRHAGALTLTHAPRAGTIVHGLQAMSHRGALTDAPNAGLRQSVISAGLQSVWNLPNVAGVRAPLTLNPAASPSLFPPVRLASGLKQLHVFAPASFTGVDFTGYEIYVDGTGTVSFTNCKFAYSGGLLLMFIGQSAGAPNVTVANCEFDGTGTLTQNAANVELFAGNFSAVQSLFHNPAVNSFNALGSGTSIFSQCWIRAPGIGSVAANHLECLDFQNGTATVDHCLLDLNDGVAAGVGVAPRGGMTGALFTDGLHGPCVTTWTDNIIIGAAALHTSYTLQGRRSNANAVSLTVSGNVLEKGTSGYYAENDAGGPMSLTWSGNTDFATGAAIPQTTSPIL